MAVLQDPVRLSVPHAQLSFNSRRCQTDRGVPPLTRRCSFSRPLWCIRAGTLERHPQPDHAKKMAAEKLWQEFFSDPSQWWDHRSEKVSRRYPDFKHKNTHRSLWLNNYLTPPWVESELAAMAPGTLQSNIFSWNVRFRRFVKAGEYEKTMKLFHQMLRAGTIPDKFTFVPVLNACSSLQSLEEGRRVHEQIIQRGCESNVYVANCLVDMYVKCGSVDDAWSVFNKMPEHNKVSWGTMIGGYVKSEQGLKAMELFQKMQQEGLEADPVTFVGMLNACASVAALEEGRRVHEQIILRGYESNIYVATCLIDMYAKCGSIEDSWNVFRKMHEHDVVSWSVMIGGCVKAGQGFKAMELFREMQQGGVEPNAITFVGVLNACASVAALEEGRRLHEQIIQRGCGSDVYVATCLVDMYSKCGSMEDAWTVFNKMHERNVVSWSAMIGCYAKSGQGLKAMELFRRMQQARVKPDSITFVGVLNACTSVAALEEGRRVHKQIIRSGCESDVYVASCLVDMYAKCGSIEDAWSIFNKMSKHDVVSWSTMIGGYVKSEQGLKALDLFKKMQEEGVEPDAVTFATVLSACASVAALEEGRRVHDQVIQRGYQSDVSVANCLVDLYAKCGSIDDAWSVFTNMEKRNIVSWNAMIGGYALHGHARKATDLFKQMGREGVEIDQITFTCLLSACSHGGLVNEGLRYFKSMASCFNMSPTTEHYACMAHLLGCAGQLKEAEKLMTRIPWKRNASAWMSLLGACRIHGNVEVAERAAKRCWELDPENASAHVLLSNVYAAAGKWYRGAAGEEERLEGQVWEEPEVNNVVHSFVVNDKNDKKHPQTLEIIRDLERFSVNQNAS